ncbi:transcriptional regulator, AsnC family protein [Streptomyces bingchenggensis BCW-1]|uniref:Transcriptional regulator, AsnC family protein n=1 Tax=Streptomyces bingchenggensis (strain BCW-1) TaxID=749414 RepID=D7BT67_STRBB|nr:MULTISPECIES: Lrp/AsnC family transcriptional regulator [Streptomyces]ADI05282.1 transcriptional regulator, AsnC family protein [Streptomyces bingchenggensis BCW-1]
MNTDTVTLDDIDRGLVHALQIDGRAPLRTLGEALGVSENTAARRYRRLRSAGVLRVVGALNGGRLGYNAWTIRLRCTPDAAGAIARALAARPDTSYVHLLSGGTEISCSAQTCSSDESDALLLHRLPRTGRITAISAHLLLGHSALPDSWAGPARLTPEQTALRRAGVLAFLVDIPPAALGFRAEARLWMSVRPSRLAEVASALAEHPEVSLVAMTTGPTNLLGAVNCRDAQHLARYLTERIASLDAIRSLETAPVIRTVKRAGALLPI